MSRMGKIKNVLLSILMILASLVLFIDPVNGFDVLIFVFGLFLMARGIRMLWYYFTMARFMVGGRSILYRGLLILDLGIFTCSITGIPRFYMALYLIGVYLVTGAIGVASALEQKKYEAAWRFDLVRACLNFVIAGLCMYFIRSGSLVVYIYSAGLLYSAISRLISTFRRSEIIYIQ